MPQIKPFSGSILFLILLVGYGCDWKPYQFEDAHYRIAEVAQLPNIVNESSGLAWAADTNAFWTLNDGGGQSELYQVNRKGKLLSTLPLNGIRNVDWEELSRDTLGNLYIGDIGNNWNIRRDLRIYRINPGKTSQISVIRFRYADQDKFPPARQDKNFDCEAFFYFRDSLYLFSKNRGDRQVKIYTMSATPGTHIAKIIDKAYLQPLTKPYANRIQVSSADVSPDGKSFALLTYSAVYLFEIQHGQINFQHPIFHLHLFEDKVKQVEALAFINNHDFLFTNEEGDVFVARRKPGSGL